MLVLDTNMLSAMMSAEPVRKVANWLLGQPSELDFGHFRTAVGVASLVIEPGTFG